MSSTNEPTVAQLIPAERGWVVRAYVEIDGQQRPSSAEVACWALRSDGSVVAMVEADGQLIPADQAWEATSRLNLYSPSQGWRYRLTDGSTPSDLDWEAVGMTSDQDGIAVLWRTLEP